MYPVPIYNLSRQWLKTAAVAALLSALPLMATGPRVTTVMVGDVENEIVAVEEAPFHSNQLKEGGLMFEIITAAMNTQGETLVLTTYPIQKMVDYYLTQEKTLGMISRSSNRLPIDKKKVITLPLSLVHQKYLYYKPAHPKGLAWRGSLANLRGLRYGAGEAEETGAYAKAGIKIVRGRLLTILEKLKGGTVDFIQVQELSAQPMIDTRFAAEKRNFAVMEPDPKESVAEIVFNLKNPKSKGMADKLRKGISVILQDGRYQAIIEKYEGKTELSDKHIKDFKRLWEAELKRK